jgi:hypothetical protein
MNSRQFRLPTYCDLTGRKVERTRMLRLFYHYMQGNSSPYARGIAWILVDIECRNLVRPVFECKKYDC